MVENLHRHLTFIREGVGPALAPVLSVLKDLTGVLCWDRFAAAENRILDRVNLFRWQANCMPPNGTTFLSFDSYVAVFRRHGSVSAKLNSIPV